MLFPLSPVLAKNAMYPSIDLVVIYNQVIKLQPVSCRKP